mmetsp:Transcript_19436/g.35168  ORF Transcript_19436/g.35168 Transcript_19436/m.35168 type:complete len:542 (-) Transcript_19436:187-1812(-)|eukprot:CAMPEP_0201892826 /NCGR_PEP_ID=MMETSP0902-20130614/37325_1 /ASSEMBLY_ACC=CAM_ASM_000551 /TAXON_ID=420261 /ORGANISM="Thalassiosira antarctica, Strain CCMP982" /LENGTH=541 /DNA_ID=CAMNT_0048424423 /DNA_START=9 /DNA_END=1634 /DNA_ORIENTATION=+
MMMAATILFRRSLISMVALLLAPPSLAFSGAFRGVVTRNILIATSNSLPSSSQPYVSSNRPSVHPFILSHRALTVIRGGDQQNLEVHHSSSSSSQLNARSSSSSIPLPESFEERKEDVEVALRSVFAACRVTRHVQPITSSSSKSIGVISKQDASPVTIGDFASQALALQILHDDFPSDMFIAEEGSDALQKDEDLLRRVWEATNHVHEGLLDREQLLSAIDYGQGVDGSNQSTSTGLKRRVWCLDPIDGTKGFLRGRVEGGQYCVALSLIEDGEPVLSVLGCPNLPLPSTPATTTIPYGLWSNEEVEESEVEHNPSTMFSTTRGCMFVAVRGCGCYEIPLHVMEENVHTAKGENDESTTNNVSSTSSWTQLHVTPNDGTSKPPSQAKFCLGVERGFSDPNGTVLKIAQTIHGPDALTTAPHNDDDHDVDDGGVQDIKNSIRMDGQGKYGLLSRGDAECFLRLPKAGYIDWVWDVAPGYLILKEAGGTMTDVHGRPIDFSEIGGLERRAKLPDYVKGILGSCGGVFHEALVEAHSKVEQIL